MADMNSNFDQGITTYGADIGTASVACQPANPHPFNPVYGECDLEGDYCPHAQLIDTIIYERSIPITWAAGNERGYGTCGIAYNTISPTATGKNAIIVGATNSNDDSMTSFSSWGPTDDGRIKPDVVAPGSQVGGDGGITSTIRGDTYGTYRGTSMATPAVAGSAALMLEEWRNIHDGNDPLPSTIKAILMQTAKPLGNKGPDYSYGYGRIDVKEAIDLIDEASKIFEDSIVDQNDTDHYDINVPEGQGELLVTLVWDDYPGDPAAAKALVNDLDLIVKDPNGTRHYPWTLDPDIPSRTARRNQADNTNNVEQVCVYYPANGTWTIDINGSTVPEPVQKYSLVYSFNLIPQHTDKFRVKNSSGEGVAMFDDAGDLFLKGTLDQNSNHPPTGHDEFRIQDVNSVDVAIIDAANGKMYIKGTLKEVWQDPSPAKDEFIIENSDDGPVAYINDLGDLYLKGKLYENWTP
jgi:hypothetical protein